MRPKVKDQVVIKSWRSYEAPGLKNGSAEPTTTIFVLGDMYYSLDNESFPVTRPSDFWCQDVAETGEKKGNVF